MPNDKQRIAGVRFRNAGKIFYFHSAGMRIEAGEYVVVETVRGPEVGKVVIGSDQVVVNELGGDLKPILRLATDSDIRRAEELRLRADEILPEARRVATDAGFRARIDTAEFTLDGRRLTFGFASEERLDYRDFLRAAGNRFGAKIDMRQMGARDRARAAGGYGICGRELCCSGWLGAFPAISIRMAKEQDLPLNPQKISGLCGRLLCCLSYEEDGYREMRKTLPKLNQRCSTPTGEGRVISVNILRRQVTLLVEGQRVDVTDRDLGTVVRWDVTSRSGAPPPPATRDELVELGIIDPLDDAPPESVEWGVARPDGPVGRGRLPAPRPEPRPARPAARDGGPSATLQGRRGEGRPAREPGRPGPRSDRGAGGPPLQGPTRPFRRAGSPPGGQPVSGETHDGTPSPGDTSPPGPRQGAPRNRRRGRGGRGRGDTQQPSTGAPEA